MPVARSVLENGVAIVTERVPYLRSATAGIWVPVGSRAEGPADSGIAHFIEHMLFKGTARRKAVDISRAIESVGGTMNAYTSREFTYFYAKAMEKDFPLLVDLLSDIYRNSVFEEAELAREKGVILQEILMVDDTPEEFLSDFFNLSYWGGHPLGYPVQGTAESVGRFDRRTVVEYFGTGSAGGESSSPSSATSRTIRRSPRSGRRWGRSTWGSRWASARRRRPRAASS
jgi:predicted Zn-dependent peptidase